MTIDVLEHHDGVVHNEADRENHRQERKRVDAEAEHQHDREARDERDRDCHHRYERCPQGTKKDKDHQNDEDHGLEDRFIDRVDRFCDEDRCIVTDKGSHAGRQRRSKVLQRLTDIGGDLQWICRRLFDDAK